MECEGLTERVQNRWMKKPSSERQQRFVCLSSGSILWFAQHWVVPICSRNIHVTLTMRVQRISLEVLVQETDSGPTFRREREAKSRCGYVPSWRLLTGQPDQLFDTMGGGCGGTELSYESLVRVVTVPRTPYLTRVLYSTGKAFGLMSRPRFSQQPCTRYGQYPQQACRTPSLIPYLGTVLYCTVLVKLRGSGQQCCAATPEGEDPPIRSIIAVRPLPHPSTVLVRPYES